MQKTVLAIPKSERIIVLEHCCIAWKSCVLSNVKYIERGELKLTDFANNLYPSSCMHDVLNLHTPETYRVVSRSVVFVVCRKVWTSSRILRVPPTRGWSQVTGSVLWCSREWQACYHQDWPTRKSEMWDKLAETMFDIDCMSGPKRHIFDVFVNEFTERCINDLDAHCHAHVSPQVQVAARTLTCVGTVRTLTCHKVGSGHTFRIRVHPKIRERGIKHWNNH